MRRRDFLRAAPAVAVIAMAPSAVSASRQQSPQEVVQECLATIHRVLKETAPEGFEPTGHIHAFADGGLVCLATRPGYQFGDEKFSWDKSRGWVNI